jgi:hypothetical protein
VSCSNSLCDTTNGTCSCDTNTCANGCCSGGVSGTCELYTSQSTSSCGAGSATCSACTGGCCSTGNGGRCATQHSNGLGQNFYDCVPLNTYNSTQASEACQAWGGTSCTAIYSCTGPGSNQVLCDTVGGLCSCWDFTGSNAGYVYKSTSSTCYCGGTIPWN